MTFENQEVLPITFKLISDIRHEEIRSSDDKALRTLDLAEKIIRDDNWKSPQDLIELIRTQIKKIIEILPQETISINILRHLLKAVRNEYDPQRKNKGDEQLRTYMVATGKESDEANEIEVPVFRSMLLDHLAEYRVEVETSSDNIATQALEHIHNNEIILTLGKSRTVEKFLKHAAESRIFQVIVVESAPKCDGHEMAKRLGEKGIKTIVISDAAVFAIMSRVNKVIISTHTVMANGILCARCGTYTVGRCAKRYSVPILVLTHLYKLSPKHAFDKNAFSMTTSPENILPLSVGPLLNQVTVYNPTFDQVPTDFITLYITHHGGNAPSYLYRLLSEMYHSEDYEL